MNEIGMLLFAIPDWVDYNKTVRNTIKGSVFIESGRKIYSDDHHSST